MPRRLLRNRVRTMDRFVGPRTGPQQSRNQNHHVEWYGGKARPRVGGQTSQDQPTGHEERYSWNDGTAPLGHWIEDENWLFWDV